MKISVKARQNIFDALRIEKVLWNGELDDEAFLSRIFDLTQIPSNDSRYVDASGDIRQHTYNNNDWDYDWIFSDSRFNLLYCPDEIFLRFLCEMVHPVVRPNSSEAAQLVQWFNDILVVEGFELMEISRIAGRVVYAARPTLTSELHTVGSAREIAKKIDSSYVSQQITRIETSINQDPELAIGTAKEFVETICKTVLFERGKQVSTKELPVLVRETFRELKITPKDIDVEQKEGETIRRLLSNLATVTQGIAELRNKYGTGHGKNAKSRGITARHAKLAVGAAVTLAVYLYETHEVKVLDDWDNL